MAKSTLHQVSPGDLHVSEQADIRDAGLTCIRRQTRSKDDSDDKKSANVNLSLPGFSLKVVAAEFLSDDAPDKSSATTTRVAEIRKPIQCHSGGTGGT